MYYKKSVTPQFSDTNGAGHIDHLAYADWFDRVRVYLYREMGAFSNRNDSFFFNRIGVHYTIPKLHNLTAGIEVKAHLTKADFAELVVSYPLRLGKGEK